VRKCCKSKPNDIAVMAKKVKICKESVGALKAINVFTLNKHQIFNRDNIIDFSDATVQKNIEKDAVSSLLKLLRPKLLITF